MPVLSRLLPLQNQLQSERAGPAHGYGASRSRPWNLDDSSHRNDNPRPFTWHKGAEEIPGSCRSLNK